MLVKICGVQSPEDARMALEYGADLIGIILVPGRGRTVSVQRAKEIAAVVHSFERGSPKGTRQRDGENTNYFAKNADLFCQSCTQPRVVGVVMNQSLEEIKQLQGSIGLDFVQLHGKEPLNFARELPVPVIKRFTPGSEQYEQWDTEGFHSAILIDGETGGNGKLVDWSLLELIPKSGAQFILGGGLTPENVAAAASQPGVFMVDVSSGVEIDGKKSLEKVRDFIKNAKNANGSDA